MRLLQEDLKAPGLRSKRKAGGSNPFWDARENPYAVRVFSFYCAFYRTVFYQDLVYKIGFLVYKIENC